MVRTRAAAALLRSVQRQGALGRTLQDEQHCQHHQGHDGGGSESAWILIRVQIVRSDTFAASTTYLRTNDRVRLSDLL
jgi:hypothetical protein